MTYPGKIRERCLWLFLLCAVPLSLTMASYCQADAPTRQKSFLWEVNSKRGTAYLLGSVHAFKKELYPLPRKIEDAFAGSDTLVVEADIDSLGPDSVTAIFGAAFYPVNETLEKRLSPQTYELAKTRMAAFGVPIEPFQKTRPWVLALMISVLEMQKLGLDPNYGIDRYFLDKARGKKPIVELESITYQVSLFSSLSDTDQDLFLLHTLRDMDLFPQEMDAMLRAWSTGDTKAMESIVTKDARDDLGMSSVYEKLVNERNRSMASRIEEFLKSGGKYFVVLGAGHLVGKRGVPELLREKGYTVEQR